MKKILIPVVILMGIFLIYILLELSGFFKKCSELDPCDSLFCKNVAVQFECKESGLCPEGMYFKCMSILNR